MPHRWLSQDYFTDEKMKKGTVPERLLGTAMIANQDDDGRLRGDPAYLRSIAFLYDNYSLDEVREMRDHLAQINPNILIYQNDGEEYIQLKKYKRYQRPRYYHPSKFPAPPGWPFEESSNQAVTEELPRGDQTVTTGKGKGKNLNLNLDQGKGKGVGRKLHPSPSLTGLSLFEYFSKVFPEAFGRKPNSREAAHLRDLGTEISSAGGATAEQIHDAFKEAAVHQKFSISYVRAILLDWLGVARAPPR